MMHKTIFPSAFLLTACLLAAMLCPAQLKVVNFAQLDSLQTLRQRPVVVFLYTPWCRYCAALKNTTLKNKEVITRLNEAFYFVALDAEEKEEIQYKGKTFRYKPTGTNTGVNELAESLGTVDGKLEFPFFCFLTSGDEIIHQQKGYIAAKEFLSLLQTVQKLVGE